MKSSIGILSSYFVLFTLVYLPILQTRYFYRDDYIWIWPNATHNQLYKMFLSSVGQGRFLEGYTQYHVFRILQHLQSTGYDNLVRFIGIICITLLAYVLFIIFRTHRIKALYAFAAGLLICTLPAFQVYVSWIVLNPEICSVTLSALAGLIMFRAVFSEKTEKQSTKASFIILAIILLVMSMFWYQPPAMFYWSIGVLPIAILADDDMKKKWKEPFVIFYSVGIISMLIYFISSKIMNYVMEVRVHPRGEVIPLSTAAIKWKMQWFFINSHSPLVQSLNLWNITTSNILGISVSIVICVGIILSMRQAILQAVTNRKYSLLWNHMQRVLLIIITLPLSLAPTLLIWESWATYRTIISLEATICVLLLISLMHIKNFIAAKVNILKIDAKKIISVITILLTICVAYLAHKNVKTYFAELQSVETRLLKEKLQQFEIDQLLTATTIYVRDSNKKFYIDNTFRFEFGFPSTNDGYVGEIVNLLLHEMGIKKKINIEILREGEPPPIDNKAMVIEINELHHMLDKHFSSE